MCMEKIIRGSEKLTSNYGSWPTFHDAEVLHLELWRDPILQPEMPNWKEPILTAKFHLAIEGPSSREMIASLRFSDVEDLKIENFNYQNAIYALEIKDDGEPNCSEDKRRMYSVKIDGAFGVSASFHCTAIEVLDAAPVE